MRNLRVTVIYVKTNVQQNFYICISVPLRLQKKMSSSIINPIKTANATDSAEKDINKIKKNQLNKEDIQLEEFSKVIGNGNVQPPTSFTTSFLISLTKLGK